MCAAGLLRGREGKGKKRRIRIITNSRHPTSVFMFLPEKVAMKCPRYEPTRAKRAERSSAAAAAEPNALRLKASPVKEPTKPECPPEKVAPPSPFPLPNQHHGISAVHDKENSSKEHDRTLCTEGFEDSGYLSLHNSQIDEDEEHTQGRHATAAVPHQDPIKSPRKSGSVCTGSLPAVSTPLDCPRRKNLMYSLSSTPSKEHDDPNLPIIKFQRAVCEELSRNYSKTKRYDWSIVGKVAESHLLDRVIGGQMGLEYVDIFSSLLSRNMRSILTGVLALLGDMDLISCKKVSKTWRKIICEDTAAMSRCQRAERTLQESTRSLRQRGCGLTRDTAESRVVLSCMQTMASFKTPSSSSTSSSTPSCGVNRRPALSQRGNKCGSGHTRFQEFVQAASCLKQHESLRPCKRCGSPATHSAEAQRATCKRQSCQFDFCTRCQETYHGSTPCRVVNPRLHYPQSTASPILPGSARSKRNLRRL